MATTTVSGSASIINKGRRVNIMRVALTGLALLLLPLGVSRAGPIFQQMNLVSSVSGLAPVMGPDLKNPWGVSFAPAGPFSVSNQVTGTATQYDGNGTPQATVITILPAPGSPLGPVGSPTGQVYNSTSDFQTAPGGSPAVFLFATLDGTISAWNGGAIAERVVLSATGASYTGLALANNGTGNFLYAANHASGGIDVFNGAFAMDFGFSFLDPSLTPGFVAHNIQNLGGTLYVTYENQATGGGIVDAFDPNGVFLRRISGNSAGGPLDRPWGVALAPADFGPFGGALLVGNAGDGRISAFDALTGQFLGQLLDAQGIPIANPGLRGLIFGNGGMGGDPNTLYFAAGIQDEREGLFGSISPVGVTAVPEPSSALLWGIAGLAMRAVPRRRRSGS